MQIQYGFIDSDDAKPVYNDGVMEKGEQTTVIDDVRV
jgi:hypothetical protein